MNDLIHIDLLSYTICIRCQIPLCSVISDRRIWAVASRGRLKCCPRSYVLNRRLSRRVPEDHVQIEELALHRTQVNQRQNETQNRASPSTDQHISY